jgi:hypothetical protein
MRRQRKSKVKSRTKRQVYQGWLVDGKGIRSERRGRVLKELLSPFVSFFDDCLNRAYLKAASTFSTFLVVDYIGFPFFNGFRRTFFCTGPTSHTFFRNDISHGHHLL